MYEVDAGASPPTPLLRRGLIPLPPSPAARRRVCGRAAPLGRRRRRRGCCCLDAAGEGRCGCAAARGGAARAADVCEQRAGPQWLRQAAVLPACVARSLDVHSRSCAARGVIPHHQDRTLGGSGANDPVVVRHPSRDSALPTGRAKRHAHAGQLPSGRVVRNALWHNTSRRETKWAGSPRIVCQEIPRDD